MLNEILKAIFAEMDGMSEEAVKNALSNVNIKVVRNGETVMDIENGEDKLAKEEIAPENKEETSESDFLEEFDPAEEEVVEEFGPGERFTEVTPFICKDDFDESYYIRNSVKGNRITEETELVFDSTGSDDVTSPGVTDADLVWVLLYRNRENEVLREKLIDILKSF